MQHTVSEKFISNLLDTFSVSDKFFFWHGKVKNLLNMNNSQVTPLRDAITR